MLEYSTMWEISLCEKTITVKNDIDVAVFWNPAAIKNHACIFIWCYHLVENVTMINSQCTSQKLFNLSSLSQGQIQHCRFCMYISLVLHVFVPIFRNILWMKSSHTMDSQQTVLWHINEVIQQFKFWCKLHQCNKE